MSRFFDKATKAELIIGKPFKIEYVDSMNNHVRFESNMLTPNILNHLILEGAVVVSSDHPVPEVNQNVEFYMIKVGNKFGLNPEDSIKFFTKLASYSPSTSFSMLLKQIAFELDKKYPNHIKDSEHIFAVSLVTGRITEIPKDSIRSYKNFAAFRTSEDAKIACRILRHFYKLMFANDSK